MRACDKNIEIFKDTLQYTDTHFKKETGKMIERTFIIKDGATYLPENTNIKEQNISILQSGTVATLINITGCTDQKIGLLNFADAEVPGGCVLQGDFSQEECLCRCSNLYYALNQKKCIENYYEYNSTLPNVIYSDRIIYSPDVMFVKDENYSKLLAPVKADVITCPAPIMCSDKNIFINRIKCIIGSAYHTGVDVLILGAWGTGAFGNDSEMVAEAFKEVLAKYKLFTQIFFAIRNTSNIPDNNFNIFSKILQDE